MQSMSLDIAFRWMDGNRLHPPFIFNRLGDDKRGFISPFTLESGLVK